MYPNHQVPDVEIVAESIEEEEEEEESDVPIIAECTEYTNVCAKVACELDSYKMVAGD